MTLSVCQFGTYPPPVTGISVHIKSLAEQLRQAGCAVRIIDTTASPRGGRLLRSARGMLHYAAALLRGMGAREDVVHAHACVGLTFWSRLPLLLALRLRRKPAVLTTHSGNFRTWAAKQRLTRLLLRFTLRLATRIIALNDDQHSAYLSLGYPPERLSLIPPFVGSCGEVGDLPPQVVAFAECHSPLICVSGGWRRLYAIEGFLAAFLALRQTPEFAASGAVGLMSFSAHDDPAYRAEVAAQVKEAGLSNHVLFLPSGQTPHDQALSVLLASDAVVRASLHDGDAVSVREALQLGTVTLASDTGMRPAGCLLFPPGDSDALATLLVRALRHRDVPQVQYGSAEENFARTAGLYQEAGSAPRYSERRSAQ